MTLVNINYKCKMLETIENLVFNPWKPRQHIYKCSEYTIIVFPTGNCRIMGCKSPLQSKIIYEPYKILIERIQSITVVGNINQSINLYKLSQILNHKCMFEPEIFPALRIYNYNPLCVNVFSSGKILIFGIKSLNYSKLVGDILSDISKMVLECGT